MHGFNGSHQPEAAAGELGGLLVDKPKVAAPHDLHELKVVPGDDAETLVLPGEALSSAVSDALFQT